jgi:histone-lysine N-methyltransferase SETMAR
MSLERVRSIIHEDLDMWKVTKGALFLQDNAPAQRALATQKKLVYLGFQCLDHTPYSPNLAPSDYHMFPGLKKN